MATIAVLGIAVGGVYLVVVKPPQATHPLRHRCGICGTQTDDRFLWTERGLEYLCHQHRQQREKEIYSERTNRREVPRGQPVRQVAGVTVVGAELTDRDVEEIGKAIGRLGADIDKRIIAIQQITPDSVEVTTGEIRGPLDGGGQILYLQRAGETWQLDEVSHWLS